MTAAQAGSFVLHAATCASGLAGLIGVSVTAKTIGGCLTAAYAFDTACAAAGLQPLGPRWSPRDVSLHHLPIVAGLWCLVVSGVDTGLACYTAAIATASINEAGHVVSTVYPGFTRAKHAISLLWFHTAGVVSTACLAALAVRAAPNAAVCGVCLAHAWMVLLQHPSWVAAYQRRLGLEPRPGLFRLLHVAAWGVGVCVIRDVTIVNV